jgi:hypothetical protein
MQTISRGPESKVDAAKAQSLIEPLDVWMARGDAVQEWERSYSLARVGTAPVSCSYCEPQLWR